MTDPELGNDGRELALRATAEIAGAIERVTPETVEEMCDELQTARRIACYGVGREGLMMKALCMRLAHLGLDAHVVGDMTTPPLNIGDLLVASAGPGTFSTVLALLDVARGAGARTLVVTAQSDGEAPHQADTVVYLPAQTMADEHAEMTSTLPMGSLFEVVELIFFDVVTIRLRERLGQSADEMRARHTNLE